MSTQVEDTRIIEYDVRTDEMLVNMSFNLASLGIMPSAATIGLLHDRTRAAGDEETARRLATAVEALVNKERL